ncbi:FixH family protein [Haliea sp. E17]|uniref:FixH family protein n=1 Tax=Haliea sp. E17 TaxID=3401576 RepID=UPI003AAB5325
MNTLSRNEDELPWYRQFWPWFLILLPATVVVAGITMVFIAASGADDLVVDEYYKRGLAINRQLAQEEAAQRLGISAQLRIDGEEITVATTGPARAQRLQLALSHPMEADRDFSLPLVESTPGIYRGRLPASVAPRWHWTLAPEAGSDWRLSGVFSAADFTRGGGG